MLTPTAGADPVVAMDQLRLRVAAGVPPEDVTQLPPRTQRAVAVALAVGAPLLEAIDGAQAAEDDAAQARRAITVASAQTKVVAAGLLVAPAVLVPALGRLVGADLVGFYTSGLGLLVLGAGGTLLLIGGLLVTALVRRVGRAAVPVAVGGRTALLVAFAVGVLTWRLVGPVLAPLTGLIAHHLVGARSRAAPPVGIDEAADLAATALAGGVSAAEALRVAAEHLPDLAHRLGRLAFGLELGMTADDLAPSTSGLVGPGTSADPSAADPAVARPPGHLGRARTRRSPRGSRAALAAVGRGASRGPSSRRPRPQPADAMVRLVAVLATADEVGAPIAPTLRRLARDLRADELARVLAAAERLPAQLTFPTALCLLPATVLLVGAPIVHAGLVAAGA